MSEKITEDFIRGLEALATDFHGETESFLIAAANHLKRIQERDKEPIELWISRRAALVTQEPSE